MLRPMPSMEHPQPAIKNVGHGVPSALWRLPPVATSTEGDRCAQQAATTRRNVLQTTRRRLYLEDPCSCPATAKTQTSNRRLNPRNLDWLPLGGLPSGKSTKPASRSPWDRRRPWHRGSAREGRSPWDRHNSWDRLAATQGFAAARCVVAITGAAAAHEIASLQPMRSPHPWVRCDPCNRRTSPLPTVAPQPFGSRRPSESPRPM